MIESTGTYFIKKDTPDSTCFSEIGYDYENSILFVRFRDSGVAYIYYDVPTDVWNGLSTYTDSKGNYFYNNIKGKYTYKRLYD